ncbi:hypothetical protein C8R48DRAFT_679591 [Suillus tomentosus]|nr:hypothetical protein C8R48DRAFT_679591 [Suillus tomentosus]
MRSGKLLQPRKPLPVPEGSVDNENREQSLTKDSDMLADDTTVVDSALGKPTIKRSNDRLLTNLQLDEMIRDGDLHMILDNDEEVLPVPHPVDPGIQSPSISHNFHLRRKQSLAVRKGLDHALDELSPAESDHGAKDTTTASARQMTQREDKDSMSPAPLPTRVDKSIRGVSCVPADEEEEEVVDDDEHVIDDEQDLDTGKVPGQLPQEAIRKALALGEKTQQEAKKIAKEYGKDVQTILIAAGLTQKATRSENSWNLHQSWYKEKFPKSIETSTMDWKKEQQAHWKVHRDETEHPQLWKEICELLDEIFSNRDKSSKAISTHIMAVRNAFASSAEYYSRLEDIHVGGLVIYVGADDKARQALGIFGGSLIKDLVNEQQADLKRLIDYATMVIKYKLIDPTASVPSFPQITAQKYDPDLHCDDGEGVRDRNCRVAPLMMLDKFEAVHIAHEGKNISWKTMLNSLYIHQLQVIDWPAGVPPIGCDFVFKDLNTGELKALVDYGAELVRVETKEKKRNKNAVKIPDNEFKFEPWSDDAKAIFEREDNEMFNITLVTDTEGKVLRTLMDCVAFMKNLPDGVVPPRAATPLVDAPTVLDLPPSSPMQWDPSPPRREFLQLLPSRSRPIPVPTKVHHRQPTEAFVQHTSRPTAMPRTSRPEPARSLTTQPDSHHRAPQKVPAAPPTRKRRWDDESEGEHGLQRHRTRLPRVYESPSPPPIRQRHQYSYSHTSNAVAGSLRLNTNDWKSKSPEVYYDDDGFDGEFHEPSD